MSATTATPVPIPERPAFPEHLRPAAALAPEDLERAARAHYTAHGARAVTVARGSDGNHRLALLDDRGGRHVLRISLAGEVLGHNYIAGRNDRAAKLGELPAIHAACRRSRRRKAVLAGLRRAFVPAARFTGTVSRLAARVSPSNRPRGVRARPARRQAQTASSVADSGPAAAPPAASLAGGSAQ